MDQLSFSVFGDSISTFEGYTPKENAVYYSGELRDATGVKTVDQTWWMRVIDAYEGRLCANAAYSGSMVQGAGFPAGQSSQRIAQIAGAEGEHPDVILVFYGINDYGWGSAQAQAEAQSTATPAVSAQSTREPRDPGLAPCDAAEQFEHAYSVMLKQIRATYPQAEVWCLTLLPGREKTKDHPAFCYALRGVAFDTYNDAIRRAAEANTCKVADIRACGFDYEATDGTHPTDRGMEQIASMVVAAMQQTKTGTFNKEALALSVPESLASERLCILDTCVGCPFARSTDRHWSCICEKS